MAHNYFKPKIVKRSAGQNAIKSAAYNDRAKYVDERTGKVWDYGRLGGLEFRGIFAPKDAPSWVKDANDLWQEVENREDQSPHRDTAQVARSFIVPLPHELNKKDRQWLVTDFARGLSREGMIVHVAIHQPEDENDQRNYHVHMLVTMREITKDGFGNKVREWNDREEYKRWNERWSELGARYLRRAGHEVEADRFEVGHLPRAQQQQEAEKRGDEEWAQKKSMKPEKHRGPAGRGFEEREVESHVESQNREIRKENERRWKEAKRDYIAEIRKGYEESKTPEQFVRTMKVNGLTVAKVSQEDLNIAWRDFSVPHHELEIMKRAQAKGAWTLQEGGMDKLRGQIRDDAEKSYAKYRSDPSHKMGFSQYVEFVQNANGDRMRGLENYVRNIDFADDNLAAKRPEYRAQVGDYVVLNKRGFVYKLDERTTGDTPKEVRNFLDKGPAVLSVTETRGMLEATRVATSLENATQRLENATKRNQALGFRPEISDYRRVGRATTNLLNGAIDSVLGLFEDLIAPRQTPESRAKAEVARLLREQQELRNQQDRSRER